MNSGLVGCKGRKASLFTSLKRLEINFQTLGNIKDINELTPPAERGQHVTIRCDIAAHATTHSLVASSSWYSSQHFRGILSHEFLCWG